MAAAARQGLAALDFDLFENSSGSDSDISDDGEQRIPRNAFHNRHISERFLFQHTRLNRIVFEYVLGLISPALTKNTRSGRYLHLTPMQKLYVALQFYATGSFQWLVGSSGRVSQPSASRLIGEVTEAIVALAPQFIRFPNAEEYLAVKQVFYQIGQTKHGRGFPNVLDAIDCTHVRIQTPTTAPEQYVNRHIYHSIIVQLVVGPDLKIFNSFAEFPGSNHDSYVWRNSALREALTEGNFPEGWLIGDSGYPQEPWLMTPVGHVNTPPELLYNSVHISTRNPVERTNGVLKSRWHVLDCPLKYSPRKVCRIATDCCVLHNICTEHNLDVEDFQEHPLNDEFPCQEPQNPNYDQIKRHLIARYFT